MSHWGIAVSAFRGRLWLVSACLALEGCFPSSSAPFTPDSGTPNTNDAAPTATDASLPMADALPQVADASPQSGDSGDCAANQTACNGLCVDLQTSADNCGACERVCATSAASPSACIAAKCQPIETVVSDPQLVGKFAVAGGRVFYFSVDNKMPRWMAQPLSGAPPQLVSAPIGGAYVVVSDDASVYTPATPGTWFGGSKVAAPSGIAVRLTSTSGINPFLVALSSTDVYLGTFPDPATMLGEIVRIPKSSDVATHVTDIPGLATALTVSDTSVFFSVPGAGKTTWSVLRAATTGGPATPIAQVSAQVYDLMIHNSKLLISTATNVVSVPVDATTQVNTSGELAFSAHLIADGSDVLFVPNSSPATLMRYVDGGEPTMVVDLSGFSLAEVVPAIDYFYFLDGGYASIRRIHR